MLPLPTGQIHKRFRDIFKMHVCCGCFSGQSSQNGIGGGRPFERVRALSSARRGSRPGQDLQEAKKEVQEAKRKVQEAKKEVQEAERKVEKAKEEVKEAKASGRTKESEAG